MRERRRPSPDVIGDPEAVPALHLARLRPPDRFDAGAEQVGEELHRRFAHPPLRSRRTGRAWITRTSALCERTTGPTIVIESTRAAKRSRNTSIITRARWAP